MDMKPTVILTEFENKKSIPLGYKWQDMADLLVANGYKVAVAELYPIAQYGGSSKFRSISTYPCELNDNEALGNLFATLDQKTHEQLIQFANKYLK